MRRTYALYWERFGIFFRIALPPAVVAYFCQFVQRFLVQAIRANGWMPSSRIGSSLVLTAVVLFQGALYWVISAFFFASVASNVLRQEEGQQPLVADAFRLARARFGPVAAIAFVAWAIFALGRTIVGFALLTIGERLGLPGSTGLFTLSFAFLLLLLAGLLSRLGLAIPALVDNPGVSVSQALRSSVANMKNWEPFFTLFLAKSAIVGYAAYWVLNLALTRLYERGMPRAEIRVWLASVLYIYLAAMLASPLFIAFSLLHRDSRLGVEDAVPAAIG